MASASPVRWVHASAVLVREAGILIRGPSGSGKTTLALHLVTDARREGGFASLVADDRCGLFARSGRLIALAHPELAGLVERRFWGIVGIDHEPSCVVRLVVDLALAHGGGRASPRLPDPDELSQDLCGIVCPTLKLPPHASTLATSGLILHRLATLRPSS